MVSLRWLPVWQRNFSVWRTMLIPSLIGNFGEPLLYLVALGYGLGRFIGELGGLPYIVFLASGVVCSSAMNAASFEGLYSVYTRMAGQRTWDAIMTAPVDIADIVLGEVVWAGTKSLITATAILLVAASLGLTNHWQAIVVLPFMLLIGCTFAAMALVVTAFAKSYEFFLYYFTLLITPMMLFSGVFFPLDSLPKTVQIAAQFLPLSHAIQIVRPLFVGEPVQHLWLHVLVLVIYGVAAYNAAVYFFKKRLID